MSYLDTDWSLVDFDPPKQPAQAGAQPTKGTCPKCGKHVGKGVHFHAMACDGPAASSR